MTSDATYDIVEEKRGKTMLHEITHEKYGEIVFDENFWTGKKKLSINGTLLNKVARRKYSLNHDGAEKEVTLVGNYLAGSSIEIDGEKIQLTPRIKWYEMIIPIIFAAILLFWGTSVELCKIVPILGGAIGGAINGIFTILNIFCVKSVRKIYLKIIIAIVIGILNFLVCWFGAIIFLSLLSR